MKKAGFAIIILHIVLVFGVISALAAPLKTASFNDWTIELPEGWSGDNEMGMYWPGEIPQYMGRPAVSIHMGGIPVMGKETFEDRVKQHINSDPTNKKDVTVEGMNGFTCNWEVNGKKHYGLFLEEDVGGVMRVINFIDCRAPAAEFSDLEKEFVSAVKTAKKK